MKILKPFKSATKASITQGFHSAHLANDFGGKFGEFLVAPFNAKVASITGIESDADTPDWGSLTNGYGIRLISMEDPTLSCTYWHCQPVFPYKKEYYVDAGKVVAMMGNSGFVVAGGGIVEVDRKLIPPYPGTHVHWSMGTQVGDQYTHLDPSTLIDWTTPVNYSFLETAYLFVLSLTNYLKGRNIIN